MDELRCSSKKFGEVVDDHTIEIKCSSRFCGARPGVVVIHRFDILNRTTTTQRFKDPKEK